MADTTIAQIEIAVPGYVALTGKIAKPEGDHGQLNLDDVAIELHELVNSMVMSIREFTNKREK